MSAPFQGLYAELVRCLLKDISYHLVLPLATLRKMSYITASDLRGKIGDDVQA